MPGDLSPSAALDLGVRLACVGRLVTVAELLVTGTERRPGGLLDWGIAGLTNPRRRTAIGAHSLRVFQAIGPRMFTTLLAVDAAVGVALVARPAEAWLLLPAVVLHVIEMKRHHLSVDGADQMMLLILVAALIGRTFQTETALRCAVTFLAAQACLAYLVSGLYKASSTVWQSGAALTEIMQTRVLGHAPVARILRDHPQFSHLAGLAVIAWESSAFIALAAPRPFLIGFLLAGIGFHLGCAAMMGLNTFVWAFAATYPAIVATNVWIRPA
ncbi:MAG: hypothetical protein ACR2OO_07455, partial [Thermomicrobiales bacterium]